MRHIYNSDMITLSMRTGTPINALCGHMQVITDPAAEGRGCRRCARRYRKWLEPLKGPIRDHYEPAVVVDTTPQPIRDLLARTIASHLDAEQGSLVAEEFTPTPADARLADRILVSPAIALVKAAALDEAYAIAVRRGLYETGIDILARAAEYEAEAAR